MNPLSPLTYYLRHKKSALLQIALISLVTTGLFLLVAVLGVIPLRANFSYLGRLSRVIPTGDVLDPAVVSQIQTHPDVARTIPDNGLWIFPPTLIGSDSQRLLGVSPEDAQVLMQHCGVRLKEGRLFEPHSNEILLSEEIARALNLDIGDEISREVDQDYYGVVSTPLILVGILENDPDLHTGPSIRMGFVSASFLNSHELYAPRATSLLVIAQEGRKATVDAFLETTITQQYTKVETFTELAELVKVAQLGLYIIFGLVNNIVAIVVAFVVGIINRLTITKRLSEFGLLNALGHDKKRLIRRLTLETATVAGIGSLVGLGIALTILSWLRLGLFYNLGMEVNLLNPAPFCFTLPIPLVVILFTWLSVKRIFARMDAVAIVERGKLSQETKRRKPTKRSNIKPLSSLTFYLRHRRRGALMLLGTVLMMLGVVFPVFLLASAVGTMLPEIDYLQQVSEIVSPARSELDAGTVGQIKSHPSVARTILAIPLSLRMVMPPGGETSILIYGVSETDLAILLELYGLQVQEGHLPQPRSNEIVISAAIATNRDLQVGDVLGGKTESGGTFSSDDMPTEMVIVGLLSPDRPWTGFASFEFLSSHELTTSRSRRLLIIPHEGQKPTLDRWLEDTIDSAQTSVITYGSREQEFKEMRASMLMTFVVLECMIAAIAAVALTTLNYVFFMQRKEEFGILNSIGRNRLWLVLRTVKETSSVTGIAWLTGAALCMIGLVVSQSVIYTPRGLTLNFFDPAPWLFTIPLPLAVILVSAGTIGRVLSRLDPVSIIERR